MTDVGQEEAKRVYAAAMSGELHMEPDAARQCAAHCDRFVDVLTRQLNDASLLSHHDGMGNLASATELRQGFDGKGDEAVQMIKDYREATLRFKAAFLAAGALFADADAANSQALSVVEVDRNDH